MGRNLDLFNDGTTGEVIARLPRAGGSVVLHARGGSYPGARLVVYSGPAFIAAVVDVRSHEIETVRDALQIAAEQHDKRQRGARRRDDEDDEPHVGAHRRRRGTR